MIGTGGEKSQGNLCYDDDDDIHAILFSITEFQCCRVWK